MAVEVGNDVVAAGATIDVAGNVEDAGVADVRADGVAVAETVVGSASGCLTSPSQPARSKSNIKTAKARGGRTTGNIWSVK